MKLLIMLKDAGHIEHGVTADRDVFGALVLMVRLLARQSVAEHFRALADDLCPNASAGDDPEREKESHT